MLEAQLGQDTPCGNISGAAQRCVYNLDIVSHFGDYLGMDDLLLQFRHIGVVDLFADNPVKPLLLRFGLVHGLHGMIVLDGLDFLDNLLIIGRRHLCAVLPVYLVAVVFRRIVARRYHDARGTPQRAKGEGKLRRGTKRIEHICLDAVGSQAQCSYIRKLGRHPPGIIGDGNALILRPVLQDKIGKPLGGFADRVYIHAVGAGADNPPQASGTELQLLVKPFLNLPLVVLDGQKLILGSLVKVIILQPEIKLVHKTHFASPLFCAVLNLKSIFPYPIPHPYSALPRMRCFSLFYHILSGITRQKNLKTADFYASPSSLCFSHLPIMAISTGTSSGFVICSFIPASLLAAISSA